MFLRTIGFLLSLQLVSIALGAIDDTETLVDLVIDTRKFNQDDVANIILAALRRADLHNAWLVEKCD